MKNSNNRKKTLCRYALIGIAVIVVAFAVFPIVSCAPAPQKSEEEIAQMTKWLEAAKPGDAILLNNGYVSVVVQAVPGVITIKQMYLEKEILDYNSLARNTKRIAKSQDCLVYAGMMKAFATASKYEGPI